MNCYNIKHGNKYKSPRVPNAVQTMCVKCKSNDRLHPAEGIVILIGHNEQGIGILIAHNEGGGDGKIGHWFARLPRCPDFRER